MTRFFHREITDWTSWGAVYQSLPDFQELIEEIFKREQLREYEPFSLLTPGTNAVFKAGGYVIKLFAPVESGAQTDKDYEAELQSMQRAIRLGIRTPRVVAASYIQDKYRFRYLIMDYIEGQAAGGALRSYTSAQKKRFVQVLLQNLDKLNGKPQGNAKQSFVQERVAHNPRWNRYPSTIRSEIIDLVQGYEWSENVHVHGDLTADNLIIDPQGVLHIIDFADSQLAPAEYEYPPILFDLFDCDRELIQEFRLTMELDQDSFLEKVFMGTILHEFGASFVHSLYEKLAGKPVSRLKEITELKRLMRTRLLN